MTDVRRYEAVLRQRFPGVVVREDDAPGMPSARTVLDVFLIPDERGREFMEFVRRELPAELAKKDLPAVAIVPHGVAATLEHYPEVVAPDHPRRDTLAIWEGAVVVNLGGWIPWVPRRCAWRQLTALLAGTPSMSCRQESMLRTTLAIPKGPRWVTRLQAARWSADDRLTNESVTLNLHREGDTYEIVR